MATYQYYQRPRASQPAKEEPNWLTAKKTCYLKNDVIYTEDDVLVKKLILRNVAPALMPKHLKAHFMTFGRVERLQLLGVSPKGKGSSSKPRTKTGYVIFADALGAAKAMRRKVHHVNKERLTVRPSDSWHQPDAYGPPEKDPEPEPETKTEPQPEAQTEPQPEAQTEPQSEAQTEPETETKTDPDAKTDPEVKIDPETETETKPMEEKSLTTILNLNDHCLEHIASLLTAKDRVRFARSCLRFRSIYNQVSPVMDKLVNLEIFIEMTLWDVRDFFLLSGRNVKQIDGIIPPRHSKRLCVFMGIYCTNLTTLNIKATKLTATNLNGIFQTPNPLQNLQLRGCDLRNDALMSMRNLIHLKTLDLSNNQKLTGQHLDRLPTSIESLTLTCCSGIQAAFLTKICKTLPHLKELHMRGIHGIGDAFKELVFDDLEAITVSNGITIVFGYTIANQYEHIAKLPSLKKVVVHSHDEDKKLRTELLKALVRLKAEQLEHFEARGQNCLNSEMFLDIGKLTNLRTLVLPHNDAIAERELESLCMLQNLREINLKYCSNVNDNSLLRLIVSCSQLHVLHLQNCPSITERLLFDVAFKVGMQRRRREIRRTLPIQMNVHGSCINKMCLEKPELASRDIVDVNFADFSSDLCYFDLSELLVFEHDDYFGGAMNLNFDRHNYNSASDDDYDIFGEYEDYDDFGDEEEEEDYSDFDDYWD